MPTRSKSPHSKVVMLAATGAKKSAAGASRAESLIALILRRKQRITEDFFEIGEALRELFRKKHFAALGYPSFEAMLDARSLMGATQARKLIAIVDAYTRDQALALGLEKAFAVITYAAATPAHEVPALVLATGIDGKPLSSLSAKVIATKAQKLRARRGASRAVSPVEREARRAAATLQALLRKGGLRAAVASVHRVAGHTVVDVRIPVEQVERAVQRKSLRAE